MLGLDEASGFRPIVRFNAVKIRDDLASTCADDLQPPVRAEIEIVDFEDHELVVATVPELEPRLKPCYVKARGEYGGSFTRGGDGDRKLTEYEIALLHANRGQPLDDHESVPGATYDDLEPQATAALLRRVRARQPLAFRDVVDEIALLRLGVLVRHTDGELTPSLAGMLALGRYPQQFFPQLMITFVSIPATSKDAIPTEAPRFLDNRSVTGPIPVMVDESIAVVVRNMSARAVVSGAGRQDVYDDPAEALREAVTNAVMHRDYSRYARGTQVQIEMFQDRLVIRNPGGLFGTVTEDDLGQEGVSSSRNGYLATLLQDVTLPGSDRVVCENRGTGIPSMIQYLRRDGLTTPEFASTISRFSVTFPRHTLLDTDTIAWIDALGQDGLTDSQVMALALMRQGRHVTNASLRQLGDDSREATNALADLVARGLATRVGGRRYATYVLDIVLSGLPQRVPLSVATEPGSPERHAPATPRQRRTDRLEQVYGLFTPGEQLRARDVMSATELKYAMALRYLNRLLADGRIVATAPPTNRRRAYRLP